MAELIKNGDFITIDYVGKVKSTGKIFDLTREDIAKKEGMMSDNARYGPVTIVVGAKHVIPGLDQKLIGLKVGDAKSFDIAPENGFGTRDSSLIKLVPMSEFRQHKINPVPGLPVNFGERYGFIQSVSGGRVKVDFNHPLAGKELVYDVEIEDIITNPEEQIKALFRFHLSSVDTSNLDVKITDKTAGINTPSDPRTRRYINLTKEIVAGDIIKYITGVETVKFTDVFERPKPEKGDASAKTEAKK